MGCLCPSKIRQEKVAPSFIDQNQLETALQLEITHNQKRISELETKTQEMSYCEYLVKQIEEVPLSHLMKEFSEQRSFFQQQIGKFVTELCNHNCSVPELSEMLIQYLCFVSFVQQNGVLVVTSLWKEQKELVTVNTAIEYFNQQFIRFGGKLRREMAVRSLVLETKTPIRFVKTREWIKKQEQ